MVRVVVTGMGLVTQLGGINATWNAFWPCQKPKRGAAFGTAKRSNLKGLWRAEEMAQRAVADALAQAGLWDGQSLQGIDAERIGCTVSASKPLFDGDRPVPPEALNSSIGRAFGFQGESRNIVAACATGAYSIALGASWIRQGVCDVVVAGSAEPYPHPLIAAGFSQMGVLSPDGVTRPFDKNRAGFSFGEGAGVIVLESAESARRREAKPLLELRGWSLGADGHSAVAFNSGGAKIADVIRRSWHGDPIE